VGVYLAVACWSRSHCDLLVHRGWEADRAVAKGRSCVLNVEEELERRRRLDDEYSAKLHRDRYDMCMRGI
jgi:hypothetical protein